MSELNDLVASFVDDLSAAIEADVRARVQSNVESLFGAGPRRGRPAMKMALGASRPRRKGPIQL
ncbi:MAG TPA: hypothetical protein VHE61_14570, partial [Opitutaceae bacterium]|nr:hypothetical protein [Opitutaceae bacterium]